MRKTGVPGQARDAGVFYACRTGCRGTLDTDGSIGYDESAIASGLLKMDGISPPQEMARRRRSGTVGRRACLSLNKEDRI